MEVHPSARRHGIDDDDTAHAIEHAVFSAGINEEEGPPWRALYLGPDRAGNLLEVVVLERDDTTELVIHAMKMRRSYQRYVTGGSAHD